MIESMKLWIIYYNFFGLFIIHYNLLIQKEKEKNDETAHEFVQKKI